MLLYPADTVISLSLLLFNSDPSACGRDKANFFVTFKSSRNGYTDFVLSQFFLKAPAEMLFKQNNPYKSFVLLCLGFLDTRACPLLLRKPLWTLNAAPT